MYECDIREEWEMDMLSHAPTTPSGVRGDGGIYCNMADLVREDRMALNHTFVFGKAGRGGEIALRVLRRMGWRPDCSKAEESFLARFSILPLRLIAHY